MGTNLLCRGSFINNLCNVVSFITNYGGGRFLTWVPSLTLTGSLNRQCQRRDRLTRREGYRQWVLRDRERERVQDSYFFLCIISLLNFDNNYFKSYIYFIFN